MTEKFNPQKFTFTWEPVGKFKYDTHLLREAFLFLLRNKIEIPALVYTSEELGNAFVHRRLTNWAALSIKARALDDDFSTPFNPENNVWTFSFPISEKPSHVSALYSFVASHENLHDAFWDVFLFDEKNGDYQPWVKDYRTVNDVVDYPPEKALAFDYIRDCDVTIHDSIVLYFNEDWNESEEIDDDWDDKEEI